MSIQQDDAVWIIAIKRRFSADTVTFDGKRELRWKQDYLIRLEH